MQSINNAVVVWAEIGLNRLCNNLNVIANRLKPGTTIMAVVKSNAYGHGAAAIATELEHNGIEYFAVANVGEGIELRRSGINGVILILEMIIPEQIDSIFQYHLTPSIYSLELAEALALKAKQMRKRLKVHLRIDTGMGGLGLSLQENRELIRQSTWMKWLEVEGVYTHLTSDYRGDYDAVKSQLALFNKVLNEIQSFRINVSLVHAVSSLGIFSLPEAHFNMVRAGIALYGIPPTPELEKAGLQPVMQLKSRILCLKRLAINEHIGTYLGKYTAVKPLNYAIIPIGYADAFFLLTIRKGDVLIRGKRAPIIGQARMNQILVDITMIPEATVGDEVVIIGAQGERIINAQEVTIAAGIADVNCESVCLLSSRVPRVYFHKKETTKAEDAYLANNTVKVAGVVND